MLWQKSLVMSCMLCDALNGRMMCQSCVDQLVLRDEKNMYGSGHEKSYRGLKYAGQLFESARAQGLLVVDAATLTVEHKYAGVLRDASKREMTSVGEWPRTLKEYALRHGHRYGLWYNEENKELRKKTALNMHNKKSILDTFKKNPTKGISITSIVMEYKDAYKDLYNLVESGVLKCYKDSIWLCQASSRQQKAAEGGEVSTCLSGPTK